MRDSRRFALWGGYLVGSLLLLGVLAGPVYGLVVLAGTLALRAAVPWPRVIAAGVPPHRSDLVVVAGLYLACVGLFYLAFQVFTVENVGGLFLSYAAGMLVGVVGPVVHLVVVRRRPLADLGLSRRGLRWTILLALVLAAVQIALTFPKVQFGPPDGWLPLLAASVAVGAFEAVFFRGYVMAVLEPVAGTLGAAVASAGLYALYHVGYGMGPVEMLFLLGLGLVYVLVYAVTRNLLAIWPLLTPLGGFYNMVAGGEVEMPLIAVLGFVDVLGVMAAAVFFAARWQRRHHATPPSRSPVGRQAPTSALR